MSSGGARACCDVPTFVAKHQGMEPGRDLFSDERSVLVERYLHLTRAVLPAMAKAQANPGSDEQQNAWPVRNDHCFQRIVLDTVCGGIWYDHVTRPAYRHMTLDQARDAVRICEDIVAGHADLAAMNRQSLLWRGKMGKK